VITLSQGDSITIKTRLTAGEQHEAFSRMYLAGVDGKLHANPLQSGRAMITAYLVDWNLTDDDGAVVPIRGLSIVELESVLNSLDPESFAEIKAAVEGHEARMTAAREAEKKTRVGSRGDDPISRSPSVPAGELIGSVN